MLSGDRPTAYRMCFSLELCILSYSGRSNCVPFWWKFFVWLTVLPLQGFEVAYSVWEILMKLRTRLPDAFHNLMSNDNFHCKMPLKNAKFDILGSEKRHFANLIGNIDWLIVTVLQAIACKIRSKKVWFLANVNVSSRSLYAIARPSVCVCNARVPYSGGSNFRQYFYSIWYLGHPLTSTENFTEIVPGEPRRRGS